MCKKDKRRIIIADWLNPSLKGSRTGGTRYKSYKMPSMNISTYYSNIYAFRLIKIKDASSFFAVP